MSKIKGENVIIKENVFLGKNVILEDDVYIDSGAIIRDNVHVGKGSYIGSQCILGEHLGDFFEDREEKEHPLLIGERSVVRSGTIIYGNTTIGKCFQTGHRATIREGCIIGDHVRIGTLTDIQHSCKIGNYVSMHSNVFLGEETVIDDFVWIFPNVTITNDPLPPSNVILGVHVQEYAVLAAKALILPGVSVGKNSLIGAGAVVTKDVADERIMIGNPAKDYGCIRNLKNKTNGESAYPWPRYFDRGMPWKDIGYEKWMEENT